MNSMPALVNIDLPAIFTFFFIMLGPLRLIAPFAQLTAGKTEDEVRSLALRGTVLATITVLIAGFIGTALLVKWKVAVGDLSIAGGILFFLVALQLVLDPYSQGSRAVDVTPKVPSMAELQRKLVPTIVTPWGIAAVIFFMTVEPDKTWQIVGLLLGVMVLDLLVMLFARVILRFLAFPLQLIGTVLSVLQVALSVEMIVVGIKFDLIERFGMHFPPS